MRRGPSCGRLEPRVIEIDPDSDSDTDEERAWLDSVKADALDAQIHDLKEYDAIAEARARRASTWAFAIAAVVLVVWALGLFGARP